MAARRSAEDTVFVLEKDHLNVAEIQKLRRAFIGIDVLFGDFKTDLLRITVGFGSVVDRNDITFDARKLDGHGPAKIVREGANAALARQISADERNLARLSGRIHGAGKTGFRSGRDRLSGAPPAGRPTAPWQSCCTGRSSRKAKSDGRHAPCRRNCTPRWAHNPRAHSRSG